MATRKDQYPLAVLLQVAGLARSTYFYHRARRRSYSSFKGRVGRVAENVLERDFAAWEPNTKWVTDVSEFRVGARRCICRR